MIDGFADTAAPRTDRSPRTIALDNLLRKTLRVADPRDPVQIANALRARYPREAERERREIAGFAWSDIPKGEAVVSDAGAGSFELGSARDDLDRDIQTLTTFSQLKEIRVELNGWGRAVRSAAAQGLAAARLALDANQYDLAMSARRTLYQYARLARFVGVVSEGSSIYFRRFAQSCDVMASLILVAIGDGLAARGITRSTMLVRVAASELQTRRNAVITALRSLTGSIDRPLGQSEYPRGIVGYQMLIRQLDSSGQADLRSLLEENALAAAMDQLVDLTGGSSIDALRELSTSSTILLERFERLISYGTAVPISGGGVPNGYSIGSPEAPPLLAFMASLQLFVDAFARPGGARLLRVARPPILAYGLYGSIDGQGAGRLIALTIARGQLVEAIDCLAGCACDARSVALAVLLDFLLSCVDRAIDLWAVGTDPDGHGDPERRAAAGAVLAFALSHALETGFLGETLTDSVPLALSEALAEVRQALGKTFVVANPTGPFVSGAEVLSPGARFTRIAILSELQIAFAHERQIERLVSSLAANCNYVEIFAHEDVGIDGVQYRASLVRILLRKAAEAIDPDFVIDAAGVIDLPQTVDASASADVFARAPYFHLSLDQ